MNSQPLNSLLARPQVTFLVGGMVIWGATIGAGLIAPHVFLRSYLLGYLLWISFP